MLTQDQLKALKAPFPPEALSSDTSRGFELTSIKAAYVIERLNEVFGPIGIGWRFVHSPFDVLHTSEGRAEIVTEVAFQYRFPTTNDLVGCGRVAWDVRSHDWAFRNSNHDWSEPIFACGGRGVGKGSAPLTDARKSAVTDGLTKAASMIGVGHEVFKGLRVGRENDRERGGNGKQRGPSCTTFWTLYHAQGKAAGIALEVAQGLANRDDWGIACEELSTLINGAER
jgi:hypothetical protein